MAVRRKGAGAMGQVQGREHGIDPRELADSDLTRELTRLYDTRHDTLLGGSEDALDAHTTRMLALEQEFLRRFPAGGAPNPMRTRAGSRRAAGQEP